MGIQSHPAKVGRQPEPSDAWAWGDPGREALLRPSTLLTFHQALVRGKYRRLFSSSAATEEAGPKGAERVAHPRHRRAQIAQSSIRVPADCAHHLADVRGRHRQERRAPRAGETLSSSPGRNRALVVVVRRRRLVGFGVHRGPVDAPSLCRMCNAAIHGPGAPRHLSTDHDPLFEAHRWTANLRLLEIDEIKTVPHVPLSHPFVERLIGTMRRECLDHVLFWNAGDLERKLADFPGLLQTRHGAMRRWKATRR